MYKFLPLYLSALLLCSATSCKRSARRGLRVLDTATKIEQASTRESAPDVDNQTSVHIDFHRPEFATPVPLPDSLSFKCFAVDVVLPPNTINYVNNVRNELPYRTGLYKYSPLRVEVVCHPHSDVDSVLSKHVFLYRKGTAVER